MEEASSFPAAAAVVVAAVAGSALQCSLTPCKTSFAPPLVVTYGSEAS